MESPKTAGPIRNIFMMTAIAVLEMTHYHIKLSLSMDEGDRMIELDPVFVIRI